MCDHADVPTPRALVIVQSPERGRYEAWDGDTLAGVAEYEDYGDGTREFLRTEVDSTYEGRGVAGQLARGALEDTRAQGRLARPLCSYIANYIERHPEFEDLVARR